MNNAFINSYFHGGSSTFRDGYRITQIVPDFLEGHLDSLTMSNKEGAIEFIRNVLVSIFIHDTTYIKTTDLFLFFKYLSVDSAIRLLQSDCIKLIDDNGLDIGLLNDSGNKQFIGFFENSYMYPDRKKAEHFNTSFDYLIFQTDKAPIPKELKAALLYNVEKKSIQFNIDETIEKIKRELDYDFLNGNITNSLGIDQNNIENIKTEDFDKVLRLVKSNQGLLYSAILNVDNLVCEANSSLDYQNKFKNLYSVSVNQSTESFNYLTNKLGVPDFTDLILSNALSIDEFIELRQKRGSEKFRDWFFQMGHSKENAIEYLITQSPEIKNKNKILKFIRWSFSNAIGIIEPISGTIYSAADTFILDKLLSGWNPSLYLNKSLSEYLNKKAENKNKRIDEERKAKYFGKIGRNDMCPCKSGKKFKVCCGK